MQEKSYEDKYNEWLKKNQNNTTNYNSFEDYLDDFTKKLEAIPEGVETILETARINAINTATENTPPNEDGKMRGKNTIHGYLKEAWERDSDVKVTKVGEGKYKFDLKNNQFYASYVNDGHDLKKHYVPGLHINEETGVLYYDFDEPGGIYVGTKTQRVKGSHMVEKAHEAWKKTIEEGMKNLINDL